MRDQIHPSVSGRALSEFARAAAQAGVQLHAMEIFEDGECMVRWSAAPYSCGDKREMYSLSKSFTATAAGVAFGMGRLRPGDAVLDYFPECGALCAADGRWRRMTVGHLLSMNTGHAACIMPQVAFAADGVRAFFSSGLSHEPGSFFAYNTAASYLAAEIVRRATGRTVPELLARTVFAALGVDGFSWEVCADGRCQGGTGLHVSCDDVAKLGLLYLNGGVWNGERVLDAEWVRMATSLQSVNEGNGSPDWCSGYGYQFWMNRRGGFRGDGACGQLCVVRPDRKCVAVLAAECADMSRELDVLWALLDDLHGPGGGPGLPGAYAPRGALGGLEWDTGWLSLRPNPAGWSGMRLRAGADGARLWLGGASDVQTVFAPSGAWRENTLTARNFRPALWRQMPRGERAPLRFAAAARREGREVVIECRSLSAPHAFDMRFSPCAEGVEMRLESALGVFGDERAMTAVPGL